MWEYKIFGSDVYHVVQTFFIFGFLGYVMECVVLSIEQKKLITNRGFLAAPFCMIYGFSAIGLPWILRPFSFHWMVLFFSGMLIATVIELVTGLVMKKFFGKLWWDYSHKPLNYRGMLCLESSIGWGVLSVLYFAVLEKWILAFIDWYPVWLGHIVGIVLLIGFVVDYSIQLYKEIKRRRHALSRSQSDTE